MEIEEAYGQTHVTMEIGPTSLEAHCAPTSCPRGPIVFCVYESVYECVYKCVFEWVRRYIHSILIGHQFEKRDVNAICLLFTI